MRRFGEGAISLPGEVVLPPARKLPFVEYRTLDLIGGDII